MAQKCLTTWVLSGLGSILQPGCPDAKRIGASCAGNFDIGSTINITSSPDEGWEVSSWVASIPSAVQSMSPDKTVLTIVMPSEDIDVYVVFTHPNINLKLEVHRQDSGEYGGCIDLLSPTDTTGDESLLCEGFTISVPVISSQEARAYAVADSGWIVEKWTVSYNGETTTYETPNYTIDFGIEGKVEDTVVVTVYFVEIEDCEKTRLTVNIIGQGRVTPLSGLYCKGVSLSLYPIPSSGYVFSRWEYSGDGFVESGSLLVVDMSASREVTAIFVEVPGYVSTNFQVFYCPSGLTASNIVSFEYTNDYNPSASSNFHFKATFYSDSSKINMLYTAFSLADSKRWYYEDGTVKDILTDGVEFDYRDTKRIIYDPDILSHPLYSEQRKYYIDESERSEEIPLLCGVKYYVDIEAYNYFEASFELVSSIILIFPCQEEEEIRLYETGKSNKWISSGNGSSDLKVSESKDGSFSPSISSNSFGFFQIAWESLRNGRTNIYGGIWDSNKDILFSSAQGYGDVKFIENAFKPIVMTDQAENFPISAVNYDKILFYSCPMRRSLPGSSGGGNGGGDVFEEFCFPGSSISASSFLGNVKARVYEEDLVGSIVINSNKVLPVIEKQSFRLDVVGVDSAYAVRLRDSEDISWSEWINIDQKIYGTEEGANIVLNAYRIDNSRFIVPWEISRYNGIRRVCIQVLTLYGVTNEICLEIYLNKDTLEYTFKFYTDENYTQLSPVYNGYYVVKESTVYFEAIFNEETIYTFSSGANQIKYNIFQQGVDDVWNQLFTSSIGNGKIFRGSFKVYRHDGVFKKDGKAFVQIVFPDDSSSACGENKFDIYNLMVGSENAQEYQDLTPEEIYEKEKANKTKKATEIVSFKQYYKTDDENYLFGNPKYFRND